MHPVLFLGGGMRESRENQNQETVKGETTQENIQSVAFSPRSDGRLKKTLKSMGYV